jgi:hypothetical protein
MHVRLSELGAKISDKIDHSIEKVPLLKSILQKTVIWLYLSETYMWENIKYKRTFSALYHFKRIRDNREKFAKLRTIYVNNVKPENYDGPEPLNYHDNKIVTSKVLNISIKNST